MRLKEDFWLFNTPIAHRGLWGGEIIENSLPAYQAAIDKGYPIEIDLYLTLDKVLVCFHDQTLDRMTGTEGLLRDKTLAELKELSLLNSEYKIPTFDQVLNLVDGKVPLLIEIKDQPDKTVVDRVVNRLLDYKGEFAIQSFNPLYIKRVKKLAPHFIRGILGTKTYGTQLKPLTRFVVKNLALNFIIKPDFISYSHEDLPLKASKIKRTPLISWTITDVNAENKALKYAKNIIFEGFSPKNPPIKKFENEE
jgi:glycerophosphoryl diester phosphodiesterase